MSTLAKLLESNAIRDRFDRHYSGDFKTGCIGCGTDIDANFVCQGALGDIKGIVARAVRHGYSQDDAEKIWMIIRGPHCLDCLRPAAHGRRYRAATAVPQKSSGIRALAARRERKLNKVRYADRGNNQ